MQPLRSRLLCTEQTHTCAAQSLYSYLCPQWVSSTRAARRQGATSAPTHRFMARSHAPQSGSPRQRRALPAVPHLAGYSRPWMVSRIHCHAMSGPASSHGWRPTNRFTTCSHTPQSSCTGTTVRPYGSLWLSCTSPSGITIP